MDKEEANKFILNFDPRVFFFFKIKKKEIENRQFGIALGTIRDRENFQSFQTNNRLNE